VSNQTVLGVDLFPTMVSIAGAKTPVGLKLDGTDLLGMLTKGRKLPERTLFWRYRKQKAVRKGPWKLLVQGETVRLYNLEDDTGEKKNLVKAQPEMVRMLQSELAAWEQEVSAGVELRA
jgi:arylsulfatase A-like enzyme